MTSRVSTKGQVVIPREIRQRLGIGRSTEVRFEVEGDHVVLTPLRRRPWRDLRGLLRGRGLTAALEADHREEVGADRKGGRPEK